MLKLRPLIVVTGTIHVEGGEKSKRRKPAKTRGGALAVTEDVEISSDRRRANVIRIKYSRRLDRLVILRTDFGQLVDPGNLQALQIVLTELSRDAIEFNKTAESTKMANALIWEPLAGARRGAVEGWIARRLTEGDEEVKDAMTMLETPPAQPVLSLTTQVSE